MKLKIWCEENIKDCSDNQLFLRLQTESRGHEDIFVNVVNKKGELIKDGRMLIIDRDLKCLIITDNLNDDIPLKTDVDGMLLYLTEPEYRERHKEHLHQHFMAHLVHATCKDQAEKEVSKH